MNQNVFNDKLMTNANVCWNSNVYFYTAEKEVQVCACMRWCVYVCVTERE